MTPANPHERRGDGVVVACRREDDRWLFIRRSASIRAPLRVCFPGGWVDDGETQIEAAIREMREELDAEVEPLQCVWRHQFTERPLTLWGWLAELKSSTVTPNPLEVHEVLWLTADEAVNHPDILPHTDALIEALLKATD